MEEDNKQELSRREFLTWVAASAAVLALPASAAEPRRRWGLGRAPVPVTPAPLDGPYVFPDPPPAIVNPSYITIPHDPTVIIPRAQAQALALAEPSAPTIVPAAYAPPAQPTYRIQNSIVAPMPAARQVRVPAPAPTPRPVARIVPARSKVTAVSRKSWATEPANPNKMKKMNGVSRLTIHHEGSAKPNNDANPAQVVATLRLIQGQHRKRMGAGDIGYHFIIDRAGVIWQGRDWAFQGAHTSGANANNLGVMLLGNFELQKPTQAQILSLHNLVASLSRKYGLTPSSDIYGHSDFCNTACPGKYLKPQVDILRRSLR